MISERSVARLGQITEHKIFDGRDRVVFGPSPELKQQLQRRHKQLWQLLTHNPSFYILYSHEKVIHGFVPKRNFITHAKRHKDAGSVLTLDLYRAFESTTKERAMAALDDLGAHPELVGFLEENAFIGEFLPPGFPTSQDLFNAVLLPMDVSLFNFAQEHGFVYSRYADDLAFSTPRLFTFIPQEQIDSIREIITEHGYDSHKIRVGHPYSQPVEICGASLYGGRITLPTKTQRRIRGQIHRSLIMESPVNLARVWSLLGYIKTTRGKIPNSLKKYEDFAKRLQREQAKK